jgi:hypothetical protein
MMVDGKYDDETKTGSEWTEPTIYLDNNTLCSNDSAAVNSARGSRGICPMGWHIPTEKEWATMLDALTGSDAFITQVGLGAAGNELLFEGEATLLRIHHSLPTGLTDPGDARWLIHRDGGGDNRTLFTATPAGYKNLERFTARSMTAAMWTSSVYDTKNAYIRQLSYSHWQPARSGLPRVNAASVRCVQD